MFMVKCYIRSFKVPCYKNRGEEKEDVVLTWEPEIEGFDHNRIKDDFPLMSKSWILFYWGKDPYSNSFPQILLLPSFNQPKIMILDSNETYS